MRDPYLVLGVSKDATDDEIKSAYRELAKKYHPDNYKDDNPLKDLASEKMQEINAAYDQILKERENAKKYGSSSTGYSYTGSSTGPYANIRILLSNRKFKDAERELFNIPTSDRTSEWHYLISVVLMQKGRVNDAMRELELACTMDPSNVEYQMAKQEFNKAQSGYGSTYYGSAGNGRAGRSSADDACNCCANLICLDCLCECFGGDLIPCL